MRVDVPEAYVIEKLRYLAGTERGVVREAACQILRIDAIDHTEAKTALSTGLCRGVGRLPGLDDPYP